ncbi:MAG: NgoBV family restriction endonuclease [Oscillospiraceae bacterium]|nr:NgoBV family restriction endonuclease [Oscillospiraceae bacterium]
MKLTPHEIYDLLVKEDKILELQGQIKFFLGDIEIIVKQKDVVGNIMQEWMQGWLEHKNIAYALSDNSQMPPDFYLDPDDKTSGLLEVKAFNRNASPGFDIADFRMYADEIINKPYMLDVDYLIFGYVMSDGGVVTIQDVWIKKVWEITRRMKEWPVNLQIKDKVVHKIRPAVWYSTSRVDYSVFSSLEDFISAIDHTVYQNPDTRDRSGTWMVKFLDAYEQHYGVRLNIPRWHDVADSYVFSKSPDYKRGQR